MDINKTLLNMTRDIDSIKRTLRLKPNTETGGQWMSLGQYSDLSPFTLGTEQPYMQTIPRDLSLRKIKIVAKVATTNNVSNYWNIIFVAFGVSIVTLNTSAMSVATWTLLEASMSDMAITDLSSATHKYIYAHVTKTGTPGSLNLASPVMYFV